MSKQGWKESGTEEEPYNGLMKQLQYSKQRLRGTGTRGREGNGREDNAVTPQVLVGSISDFQQKE